MPFTKKPLHRQVAVVVSLISTGLLLLPAIRPVQAQTGQIACRPNDDGSGWVCDGVPPLSGTPLSPAGPRPDPAITAAAPPATDMDWVERQYLTPEQLAGGEETVLEGVGSATNFAFSLEPAGGSPQPTEVLTLVDLNT